MEVKWKLGYEPTANTSQSFLYWYQNHDDELYLSISFMSVVINSKEEHQCIWSVS